MHDAKVRKSWTSCTARLPEFILFQTTLMPMSAMCLVILNNNRQAVGPFWNKWYNTDLNMTNAILTRSKKTRKSTLNLSKVQCLFTTTIHKNVLHSYCHMRKKLDIFYLQEKPFTFGFKVSNNVHKQIDLIICKYNVINYIKRHIQLSKKPVKMIFCIQVTMCWEDQDQAVFTTNKDNCCFAFLHFQAPIKLLQWKCF